MRFLAALLVFLFAGCSLLAPLYSPPKSPTVTVSDAGAVAVGGDAKKPAVVGTSNADSVLPIPEGSTLVFNEKLGTLAITVSKATQIVLNRTETAVKGPVAFEPPKPPAVKDQAEAKADYWTILGYRIGVFIGIAAAIYGLVEHWKLVMVGGACVAGACLFGLFQQSHPILLAVIGLGIAVSLLGPYFYHTKVKPAETKSP